MPLSSHKYSFMSALGHILNTWQFNSGPDKVYSSFSKLLYV